MKIISRILVLMVFTLGCLSMASAATLKIGVVNVPKVLAESPQAETVRATLQGEFEPREKELIKDQDAIRKLDERIQRDGAIMSDGERGKLERELLALTREGKRKQDNLRDDFSVRRGELLENLQRELGDSIRAYAEKEKYDLLLGEGVIYVKDSLDITDKILDHLRK